MNTLIKVIGKLKESSIKIRRINDKEVFNDIIDYCEIFKLTFDDKNKLINIENIKHD